VDPVESPSLLNVYEHEFGQSIELGSLEIPDGNDLASDVGGLQDQVIVVAVCYPFMRTLDGEVGATYEDA